MAKIECSLDSLSQKHQRVKFPMNQLETFKKFLLQLDENKPFKQMLVCHSCLFFWIKLKLFCILQKEVLLQRIKCVKISAGTSAFTQLKDLVHGQILAWMLTPNLVATIRSVSTIRRSFPGGNEFFEFIRGTFTADRLFSCVIKMLDFTDVIMESGIFTKCNLTSVVWVCQYFFETVGSKFRIE
jgi:hypothetical protein